MIREINEIELRDHAQTYKVFPLSIDTIKTVSKDFIREFKNKIWWRMKLIEYIYHTDKEFYKELFGERR